MKNMAWKSNIYLQTTTEDTLPQMETTSLKRIASRRLPLVIWRALGRDLRRARMHVHKSRSGLIRAQDDAVKLRHPVLGPCHRVEGHGAKVAGLLQVINRLRRGLFVQGVVVDGVADRTKIGL